MNKGTTNFSIEELNFNNTEESKKDVANSVKNENASIDISSYKDKEIKDEQDTTTENNILVVGDENLSFSEYIIEAYPSSNIYIASTLTELEMNFMLIDLEKKKKIKYEYESMKKGEIKIEKFHFYYTRKFKEKYANKNVFVIYKTNLFCLKCYFPNNFFNTVFLLLPGLCYNIRENGLKYSDKVTTLRIYYFLILLIIEIINVSIKNAGIHMLWTNEKLQNLNEDDNKDSEKKKNENDEIKKESIHDTINALKNLMCNNNNLMNEDNEKNDLNEDIYTKTEENENAFDEKNYNENFNINKNVIKNDTEISEDENNEIDEEKNIEINEENEINENNENNEKNVDVNNEINGDENNDINVVNEDENNDINEVNEDDNNEVNENYSNNINENEKIYNECHEANYENNEYNVDRNIDNNTVTSDINEEKNEINDNETFNRNNIKESNISEKNFTVDLENEETNNVCDLNENKENEKNFENEYEEEKENNTNLTTNIENKENEIFSYNEIQRSGDVDNSSILNKCEKLDDKGVNIKLSNYSNLNTEEEEDEEEEEEDDDEDDDEDEDEEDENEKTNCFDIFEIDRSNLEDIDNVTGKSEDTEKLDERENIIEYIYKNKKKKKSIINMVHFPLLYEINIKKLMKLFYFHYQVNNEEKLKLKLNSVDITKNYFPIIYGNQFIFNEFLKNCKFFSFILKRKKLIIPEDLAVLLPKISCEYQIESYNFLKKKYYSLFNEEVKSYNSLKDQINHINNMRHKLYLHNLKVKEKATKSKPYISYYLFQQDMNELMKEKLASDKLTSEKFTSEKLWQVIFNPLDFFHMNDDVNKYFEYYIYPNISKFHKALECNKLCFKFNIGKKEENEICKKSNKKKYKNNYFTTNDNKNKPPLLPTPTIDNYKNNNMNKNTSVYKHINNTPLSNYNKLYRNEKIRSSVSNNFENKREDKNQKYSKNENQRSSRNTNTNFHNYNNSNYHDKVYSNISHNYTYKPSRNNMHKTNENRSDNKNIKRRRDDSYEIRREGYSNKRYEKRGRNDYDMKMKTDDRTERSSKNHSEMQDPYASTKESNKIYDTNNSMNTSEKQSWKLPPPPPIIPPIYENQSQQKMNNFYNLDDSQK
ncbi:conserved Plasmodium protein, unknown function [Plasmodium gallinaceum]|uniref:Uncharacterized protein n=1 Tax=Plasmodium gallinaceum TaxID=5849 RepID=A0A1J1H408_PLAGA|nr:conserved Plasmodium protein, unknown function [Plasmodium gallinaceum]CRG98090.1 conserved Plasmodium protein, unknown function [Plasmodium gallinaceum]